MKKKNSNTGLKRKVSATTSIIIIAGVICIALLIGFGGKLWTKVTTRHTKPSKYREKGVGGPGEKLRLSSERLGADLNPVPDVKSGGISVRAISPKASGELQAGDIITAINAEKVVKTKGLTTIAIETFKVEVGQPVTLDILRDGQPMQVQVTRLEDTPPKAGPQGMGGSRGLR